MVVVVNKLDLVDYRREVFEEIEADYRAFAEQLGLRDVVCMPMSALHGDNLLRASANTPWYRGPALLPYLESVEVDDEVATGPFRLPVQWVNRPNLDFRGFAGTIVGGTVSVGEAVRALPSGQSSTVTRIVDGGADVDHAVAGQAVTLCLAEEVDVSRGDWLLTLPASEGSTSLPSSTRTL